LGRFIFKRGLDRSEIQAPLITPGQIKRIVSKVKAGDVETETEEMAPEDVFRFAITNLKGSLSRKPLYEALGGRVSHQYLKDLSSYDGEVIEIEGKNYVIQPPSGQKPRRIEAIEAG
jgi:hypothetical protein